jgi:hypothetical protein
MATPEVQAAQTYFVPNGMQSQDSTELSYNPGYNQAWEQNGTARTAGYVDESLDAGGFFNWKKARSDDNKGRGYGPS